jgi:hypothetical protein
MKQVKKTASVLEESVTSIYSKPVRVWFFVLNDGERLIAVEGMASLTMPARGVALLDLINAGCDIVTARNVLMLISRLTASQRKPRSKASIENKQITNNKKIK